MVESPQRIWIEADDECPYFYEAHELHDVEQDVIEYVRADKLEELAAENERLKAENERLRQTLQAEPALATRSGAVKPLDEDDYQEIIRAAAINMRKAPGIRGQMITVQDNLDWWVMKETEHRILAALEPAPAAEQFESCPDCAGSGYSNHPDSGQVCYRCNGQGSYPTPSEARLREALVNLVQEIDDLVSESEGVAGLHLNGDVAEWGDLLPGGPYERLTSLDDARAALKEAASRNE